MNKLKLLWSKTNRWHRVLFIFLIVEMKVIPGGQVGFQCNDPALSHPYTGDTINWKWLMGITMFLPFVVMFIVEKQLDKSKDVQQNALQWYKEYLYGFLINLTIVQSMKFIVGSPRPHFFDTCSPKEALTCETSEFISSYTCTKAYWLSQSDRSFPSGHTSLAVHAGIFIAYYLHQRAHRLDSRSIRTIQLLSIFSALFCAVSRMMDHRHHWWDVLAGAGLALPVLAYTIHSLCKNFQCIAPKGGTESHKEENGVNENDIQT
ncbi:unnamed protein product, partial [Brenthis ino]